jgi:hypothetical protein
MQSPIDSWRDYLREFPARDPAFVFKRYAFGTMPFAIAEQLRVAITDAPVVPISNNTPDGIESASLSEKYIDILNKEHQYREFTLATYDALVEVFSYLRDPVAKLLNSPWQVLQCRSWTTQAGASEFGPNVFHTDGDLEELLKIMIYSTQIDGERGCLDVHPSNGEYVRIKGRPGVWVLFYNSILKHRGVAPTLPGFMRVATEVTVSPAHEFDLEPKSFGLVARYRSNPRV